MQEGIEIKMNKLCLKMTWKDNRDKRNMSDVGKIFSLLSISITWYISIVQNWFTTKQNCTKIVKIFLKYPVMHTKLFSRVNDYAGHEKNVIFITLKYILCWNNGEDRSVVTWKLIHLGEHSLTWTVYFLQLISFLKR